MKTTIQANVDDRTYFESVKKGAATTNEIVACRDDLSGCVKQSTFTSGYFKFPVPSCSAYIVHFRRKEN